MAESTKNREIVLPPGTFIHIQDSTKGSIKTVTGPNSVTTTGQEIPVKFSGKEFQKTDLEAAQQNDAIALETDYIILRNPARDGTHPEPGQVNTKVPELLVGHKIVLKGPRIFSLWPGQSFERVNGHKLRSNQFVRCRVYDEVSARANWAEAIGKKSYKTVKGENGQDTVVEVKIEPPKNLSVGYEFNIKGTEASFYIPPTGISVLRTSRDEYVREAVTLERMEYCVLINEDGKKRYENGPAVIFPEPQEQFMTLGDGPDNKKIKFQAIELNALQGIHLKVISEYKDGEITRKLGEELFLTGKDVQIYYPREEHAILSYDNKAKHFATAIPAGEGRYVLNRMTGEIRTLKGPQMYLPDPRTEVFVKRVLDERDVQLWYPNNLEALDYNRELGELARKAPTTRAGTVSDGELARSRGVMKSAGAVAAGGYGSSQVLADRSMVSGNVAANMPDKIERGSSYTSPRTLTLNTKYEGVPTIDVWLGYAVLVKSLSSGNRTVAVGPKRVLMEYDDRLEVLGLSTGKPKTTDVLLNTVYLQVQNNKVTDVFELETSDHVKVRVKVAYRADFEGDNPEKWFSVSNYIKLMTDHGRSLLKSASKKFTIYEFYNTSAEIIRDVILGKAVQEGKRPGMFFSENMLRVTEVEVLEVSLVDAEVNKLLDRNQRAVLETLVDLDSQRRAAEREIDILNIRSNVEKAKENFELESSNRRIATFERKKKEEEIKKVTDSFVLATRLELDKVEEEYNNRRSETAHNLAVAARTSDLELDKREEQIKTEAVIKRFEAANQTLGPVLLAMSDRETLIKVAEATSIQKILGGNDAVDVFHKLFKGTAVEGLMTTLAEKAGAKVEINKTSKTN